MGNSTQQRRVLWATGISSIGVLISVMGWRSIFLVNVPICLVGIALTWRVSSVPPLNLRLQSPVHSTLLGKSRWSRPSPC